MCLVLLVARSYLSSGIPAFERALHQALNRTAGYRYAYFSSFSPQELAEEAGAMI